MSKSITEKELKIAAKKLNLQYGVVEVLINKVKEVRKEYEKLDIDEMIKSIGFDYSNLDKLKKTYNIDGQLYQDIFYILRDTYTKTYNKAIEDAANNARCKFGYQAVDKKSILRLKKL
jgi:hypothetical protein